MFQVSLGNLILSKTLFLPKVMGIQVSAKALDLLPIPQQTNKIQNSPLN